MMMGRCSKRKIKAIVVIDDGHIVVRGIDLDRLDFPKLIGDFHLALATGGD